MVLIDCAQSPDPPLPPPNFKTHMTAPPPPPPPSNPLKVRLPLDSNWCFLHTHTHTHTHIPNENVLLEAMCHKMNSFARAGVFRSVAVSDEFQLKCSKQKATVLLRM